MADEETEGPRRKTYTPPEASEPFTGSLPDIGESESPEVVPPPFANRIPHPTSTIAPPVRTSLSDAEILARFQGENAGSTAQMMEELERQVNLREEEEEAFEMWANLTRATRGVDAESIIERERIIFDGGDPSSLEISPPEPLVDSHLELEEELDADDDGDDNGDDDAEVISEILAEDEPPTDISQDLGEPDLPEATEVPSVEHDVEPDAVEPETPEESEERDPDQWPLTQTQKTPDSAVDAVAREDAAFSPADSGGIQPLGLLGAWLSAIVPVLGLLAGSYFVVRGLGVVESGVALASGGLLAGVLIAVVASASTRQGVSAPRLATATFGTAGNALPGALLLVIRWAVVVTLVIWGSSLASRVLVVSGLWPFEAQIATITATVITAVLVIVLAVFGEKVVTIALWASAVVGLLGVGLVVGLTANSLTLGNNLLVWSADWLMVLAAGSLVLATLMVLFAPVAGEFGRGVAGKSVRSVPWIAGFAAVVPTVLLGTYVAWVSTSSPGVLPQLASDPVLIVSEIGPVWYPVPAILAMVLPLIAVAAASLNSAGHHTLALRIPVSHPVATASSAVVVVLALVAQGVFAHSVVGYFPHLVYTLGVVVVSWAATVVVDQVGTSHLASSLRWRIAPLLGFVISVALGWGLLSSSVPWLSWQGYVYPLLEVVGLIDLSSTQLGVVVAGVVAALVAGITRLVRSRKTLEVTHA